HAARTLRHRDVPRLDRVQDSASGPDRIGRLDRIVIPLLYVPFEMFQLAAEGGLDLRPGGSADQVLGRSSGEANVATGVPVPAVDRPRGVATRWIEGVWWRLSPSGVGCKHVPDVPLDAE